MSQSTPRDDAPVTVQLVRHVEAIDTGAFLQRYARAIVEVHGADPPPGGAPALTGPSHPTATSEAA